MRNYDLSTFSRSSVGFEPFFNILSGARRRQEAEGSFPPYDIVRKDETNYAIRIAAPGFSSSDLSITAQQNLLTVSGRKAPEQKRDYLYEGFTALEFERQFSLADQVEVRNASFENGILEIGLHQEVPEAAKPRQIAINGAGSSKRLS